jgi:hypothetical protein
MSKIQDVLSKLGRGGPAVNIGAKLLATVGAIGYGVANSFYTGKVLYISLHSS